MASSGSKGQTQDGHVVLFAYAHWGHTRPLCNFAARMVKAKPIHVTLLTSPSLHTRALAEISRNFTRDEEHLASFIRATALDEDASPLSTERADEVFAATYRPLATGQPTTCSVTELSFPAIAPPIAVVFDFFALGPLRTVRELGGNSVKIYAWQSAAVPYILRQYGPVKLGGLGDWAMAASAAAAAGKSEIDAAVEHFNRVEGQVVSIPGVPDMYDWEFFPQPTPAPLITGMTARAYHFFHECDGAIHSTSSVYEGATLDGFARWFSETGRPSYVVGPVLPSGSHVDIAVGERSQSAHSDEIFKFLDEKLSSHGANSVLYVSFGSFWWPAEPAKLWAFLESAIDQNVPFILSHGTPMAVLDEEFEAKANASGLAMFSPWSPQQLVLKHEAVGWFLSHCGHNSVLESILAGVPMIGWPLGVDQPVNASHLAHIGIAYELFEVRSGAEGLKPILHASVTPTGTIDSVHKEAQSVLERMRSAEGEDKRERTKQMSAQMASAWEPDGAATLGVNAFLDSIQGVGAQDIKQDEAETIPARQAVAI